MKYSPKILTPIIMFAGLFNFANAQEGDFEYAVLSAVATAPHSGVEYSVQKIFTYGACVTVEYRRVDIPGAQTQALVDHEEHLAIPVIADSFQYIDAYDQFGNPVPATFLWQGKLFEATPCPIQYITAPPSILLYEAPSAGAMTNTSNRAEITDENPAIAGFVLKESTWVIIRGIGPSMNLGSGYVDDPVITLYADQYLLDDFNDDLENSITNDNWQDTLRVNTLAHWELVPENENESALVTYLHPGPYTVHLTSNNELGSGLVEVYIAPYALLEDTN